MRSPRMSLVLSETEMSAAELIAERDRAYTRWMEMGRESARRWVAGSDTTEFDKEVAKARARYFRLSVRASRT
jgi:hypothetical protein